MGLDVSHECWNGGYGRFNRFRQSLGLQIGINLRKDYHGYGGKNPTKMLNEISHPLMPLFNHSDCDGELSVSESKQVVEGFDLVIVSFNKSLDCDDDFIDRVIQFRSGLIDAISKDEIVKFY